MTFLDVTRFVTGIGLGAEIAVVHMYVGELAPASICGRMGARVSMFGSAALAVVSLLARALVPSFESDWRVLFALGAVGGAITLALRLRFDLPVMVYRMISIGRLDVARDVVKKAERQAETEIGHRLPSPGPISPLAVAGRFSGSHAGSAASSNRVVLLTLLRFIFYIGNDGWLTLAPTLLVQRGGDLLRWTRHPATGPPFIP